MSCHSIGWMSCDHEECRLTDLDGMLEGILETQTKCGIEEEKGMGREGGDRMSETVYSIVTHHA